MQLNDKLPNYLKLPRSTDTDLSVKELYKWMERIVEVIGYIELFDFEWGVVRIDNWSKHSGSIELWTYVH